MFSTKKKAYSLLLNRIALHGFSYLSHSLVNTIIALLINTIIALLVNTIIALLVNTIGMYSKYHYEW